MQEKILLFCQHVPCTINQFFFLFLIIKTHFLLCLHFSQNETLTKPKDTNQLELIISIQSNLTKSNADGIHSQFCTVIRWLLPKMRILLCVYWSMVPARKESCDCERQFWFSAKRIRWQIFWSGNCPEEPDGKGTLNKTFPSLFKVNDIGSNYQKI